MAKYHALMDRTTPPSEIAPQLSRAMHELDQHLGSAIFAVHLFGSAVDGGLKPESDIDVLVTVRTPPTEGTRQALMKALLGVSAPSGVGAQQGGLRPLEVTVLAQSDIVPWRYPALRQMQFGEWLRDDLQSGRFESPMQDHDLAILLTKARQHSLALRGPDACAVFERVPPADLRQALLDTVAQWETRDTWIGDERNIVLALARLWLTAATGAIATKDGAADWLLQRIPAAHRRLLADAKAAYLGQARDNLASRSLDVDAYIQHARSVVRDLCAV